MENRTEVYTVLGVVTAVLLCLTVMALEGYAAPLDGLKCPRIPWEQAYVPVHQKTPQFPLRVEKRSIQACGIPKRAYTLHYCVDDRLTEVTALWDNLGWAEAVAFGPDTAEGLEVALKITQGVESENIGTLWEPLAIYDHWQFVNEQLCEERQQCRRRARKRGKPRFYNGCLRQLQIRAPKRKKQYSGLGFIPLSPIWDTYEVK